MSGSRLSTGLGLALLSLFVAACGQHANVGGTLPFAGGATLSVAQSVATPTPTPSAVTVHSGFGQINGLDNQFLNPVTTYDKYDGDSRTGGHGSTITTFDGKQMTCDPSMSNNYHVHAFVGIYYNGTEIAVPDGVGFAEPGGEVTYEGVPNQTEYFAPGSPGCVYHTHTHDPSGLVHIEDANPNNLPLTASLYTLGDFLNIWGQTVSSTTFGSFSGPVAVYQSGQWYRGKQSVVYSNQYRLWKNDPNTIQLYSHEVIWILIGTNNPTGSSLPNIHFAETY